MQQRTLTRLMLALTVLVLSGMLLWGWQAIDDTQQRSAARIAAAPKPVARPAEAASGPDLAASAAQEPGAVVLPSGLVFTVLKEGTGRTPRATDSVKVHYRGTLADGTEFDSSHRRGQPAEFPLDRVIPCWTEGLQRLQAGGKARLTCPPAIAYGEQGAGGVIPPTATLQFEVELLSVIF